MDRKQKYVRLQRYDEIIIFPEVISHDTFKHLKCVSAGFCYVNKESVSCFGKSFSLGLKSKEDDSEKATMQIFGVEAALNLK